jgi:hypothetical protein
MKRILTIFLLSISLSWAGCESLNEVLDTVYTSNPDPTSGEMAQGLKAALGNGITSAVNILGKDGGYFNDPKVKIPFPEEAQFVSNTLRDLGLGRLVDDFEQKLNAGAEEGAKRALPIFKSAITSMTFADVKNILLGGENAATDYFKSRTSNQLYQAFSPEIKKTMDQVGAAKIWTDITTRYNAIPFTNKKVETDLVRYATNKAMDGLFLKIAEEEAKIRKDPIARTSEILKKVFNYADRQKSGG